MNDVGAVSRTTSRCSRDGRGALPRAVGRARRRRVARRSAAQAAAQVEVEYEPLPAVLAFATRSRQASFHTEPHVIRRGDATRRSRRAALRSRARSTIGGQEHFYLETQAAWAEPGEDGDVFVCVARRSTRPRCRRSSRTCSTSAAQQGDRASRRAWAAASAARRRRATPWAALVALAAREDAAARCACSSTATRHEAHRQAPPVLRALRGRLRRRRAAARRSSVAARAPTAAGRSTSRESILDRALFHLDNAYYIPNVRLLGPGGEDEPRLATPRSAASAARRACS